MKYFACALAGLCLAGLVLAPLAIAGGEAPARCLAYAPAPDGSPEANQKLEAKAGAEFCLELAANPTTGYSWHLAKPLDSGLVELNDSDFQQDPATKGLMGAGGVERWIFKALAPGQTVIELAYKRPWEKEQPPVRRFTVTLSIVP